MQDCKREKWSHIYKYLCFFAVLLLISSALGCQKAKEKKAPVPKELSSKKIVSHWIGSEIKKSLPSLLVIKKKLPAEGSRASLFTLEGKFIDVVWDNCPNWSVLQCAYDPFKTRIALVLAYTPWPSNELQAENDGFRLFVLEPNGEVIEVYQTRDSNVDIYSPTFLKDGTLLWVDFDLKKASRDIRPVETIKYLDSSGVVKEAKLVGGPPDYICVGMIKAIEQTNKVAIFFQTPGTPAPDDDYAVALAYFEDGTLKVFTNAYYDDCLNNMFPLRNIDSIIFHRGRADFKENRLAVDVVRVDFINGKPQEKILLEDCGADPCYDFWYVVRPGPGNSVLFRSSGIAQGKDGMLNLLDLETNEVKETGVNLNSLGDVWMWLDKE